jgi:hypothetical protein
MIIYELFKDTLNKFKPYCLSTEKGYYNFYTLKETMQFLKDVGISKDKIRDLKGVLK